MALPKGTIGTGEFTGRSASPLPLLPDKTPVGEFVIFKPGVNDSDYGPVTFDDIAAAFVMQNRQTVANPLKFDFNHGMALKYATAEQGKSAGDFDIEVRDGCLMAVGCKWTEEAFARIRKGEYGLFSPWFDYIDTEDGVRRPFALHNVAILNVAGLHGIQQIAAGAAATATERNEVMNEAEIKAMQDRNRQLETENANLRAAQHEITVLGGTLQLAASAGATERAQAVHGLLAVRSELRKITGQDTDEKAIAAVRALSAKAARTDELEGRIGEIEAGAARAAFDAVLEGASKEGKLPPAERKKVEESILALTGGKITPAAIEAAKTNVAMLSARVVTEGRGHHQPDPKAPGLPDGFKNLGGVKPESIDKALERNQQRRAVRGY